MPLTPIPVNRGRFRVRRFRLSVYLDNTRKGYLPEFEKWLMKERFEEKVKGEVL